MFTVGGIKSRWPIHSIQRILLLPSSKNQENGTLATGVLHRLTIVECGEEIISTRTYLRYKNLICYIGSETVIQDLMAEEEEFRGRGSLKFFWLKFTSSFIHGIANLLYIREVISVDNTIFQFTAAISEIAEH